VLLPSLGCPTIGFVLFDGIIELEKTVGDEKPPPDDINRLFAKTTCPTST
jgi:hypothetical protein